jgi:hypothetical protein
VTPSRAVSAPEDKSGSEHKESLELKRKESKKTVLSYAEMNETPQVIDWI